jgi:UDPglucose 6-dehydrogenase
MNNTIGIVGYGMVGKAVEHGFQHATVIISDPQYNTTTIEDVCNLNPVAIFVCVPTPTDDSNYSILKEVLGEITHSGYSGLTVVKSTILPNHLAGFDVLYNPEFLSRATSFSDFVNPPMIIIGGDRGEELLAVYKEHSIVDTSNTLLVDISTASLAKYAMNSFYAMKITYMNQLYNIAQKLGVDYNQLTLIFKQQPWMGTHHFDVPGPDGKFGFGGPCLPKDTEAFTKEFNIALLDLTLKLNKKYRDGKG